MENLHEEAYWHGRDDCEELPLLFLSLPFSHAQAHSQTHTITLCANHITIPLHLFLPRPIVLI
jgi:hypothetical protein